MVIILLKLAYIQQGNNDQVIVVEITLIELYPFTLFLRRSIEASVNLLNVWRIIYVEHMMQDRSQYDETLL